MGLYNNRIVVKVGTSTLTNDSGKSDLRATDRLVCTLADIPQHGLRGDPRFLRAPSPWDAIN